ncbi:hypothetical protein O181_011849 [Austropuccinia psidii MF-1]|uniref:Uncharacterized protein n=1 Tax=Austropuccinia psidii MF-1 TaxID=1389203 RepID=A0A9Q3GM96_9BASI|nr:hypothetical protein [Austropuccinia psidii MF-1]
MTSVGTIIKEIIIPDRKGNIRLNPYFVLLEYSHIQGFLLGTDYQRMYGIDIKNSKNRHITIDFAIGEDPLGKIRGHDIELYLDVERPYPPMLRRPPYPAILESRKQIEKHIYKLLDIDVIRKTIIYKEGIIHTNADGLSR